MDDHQRILAVVRFFFFFLFATFSTDTLSHFRATLWELIDSLLEGSKQFHHWVSRTSTGHNMGVSASSMEHPSLFRD